MVRLVTDLVNLELRQLELELNELPRQLRWILASVNSHRSRGDEIRLISARRATRHERKNYEENID